MIHQRLDRIPKNTTMVIISDSCNSGNLVREFSPYNDDTYRVSKSIIPPEDIQARSLGQDLPLKKLEDYVSPIDNVNVIFISGCLPTQTSADAYINGRYNGALTAGIKHVMDLDQGGTTRDCLHKLVLHYLDENNFEQRPMFKGVADKLDDRLFQ